MQKRRRRVYGDQTTVVTQTVHPNVSLTRDPLRRDALPDAPTELDYAPQFWDGAARTSWFVEPLVILALVFVARVTTDLWGWGQSPIAWGAVLLAGLFVATTRLIRRAGVAAALQATVVAVVIAGVLATDNPLFALLALAFALFHGAELFGLAQRHYGGWLGAHMFAPNSVLDVWRRCWRKKSLLARIMHACQRQRGVEAASTPSDQAALALRREAPEVALFDRGVLVLVAGVLLGFVAAVLSPTPVLAGVAALATVVLVLASYSAVALYSYARQHRVPWRDVRVAFSEFMACWFSYPGRRAPGVYQSPAGNIAARRNRTTWAYRWVVGSTILLASYFPVGPLIFGPAPWLEENAEVVAFRAGEDYPTLDRIRSGTPESTKSVLAVLDDDTREQYAALSEAARLQAAKLEAQTQYGLDVTGDPEAWPVLSVVGLFSDPVLHGVSLCLALALCLTVPYGLFLLLGLVTIGRTVVHHRRGYNAPTSPYVKPRSPWDAAVERLQGSRNPLERRHAWLGVSREGDYPILWDKDLLLQHVHILGGTGSGKTSRGMAPLLEQVVGASNSVVVIDLKGDMALFQSAKAAAGRAGVGFKWFSSQFRRSTFSFNPFDQKHMRKLQDVEKSQIFSEALGLDYGPGYGKSHFSSQNKDVLMKAFERMGDVHSFAWLDYELESLPKNGVGTVFDSDKQRQDAIDLIAAIRSLARVDALNVCLKGSPPARDRDGADLPQPLSEKQAQTLMDYGIDMSDLLREPMVVYFHLPASLLSGANREIGKFALHGLFAATTEDEEHLPVHVFIDEFQQIVTDDLTKFFEQSRSKQIALVLANQNPGQLSAVGAHMLSSIYSNTFTQIVFAANDPDHRKVLREMSGEVLYELVVEGPDERHPVRSQMFIGPRFRPNDIIEMSARKEECLVTIKSNSGYSQFDGFPFRMYADFHITEEEYKRRLRSPWPDETSSPGAFTTPLDRSPQKDSPKDARTTTPKPPTQTEFGAKLDSLEP